ncbi:MAG: hypothetical protein AB8G99_20405 [Planctomycetaceae bacterium]
MATIQNLIRSGTVQVSDRRKHPRFRFRGAIEVLAVDVFGSIIPTEIPGWTTDVSEVGAVITVQNKLTNKGLFIRFAKDDDMVMPASIIRTMSEQGGFFTYAIEFASPFDKQQLVTLMSNSEVGGRISVEDSEATDTVEFSPEAVCER